ncbi:glycoside hydrolase family 3 N-terminal domain-containing protein [Amycolatopsis palatopharyngis]|uniref:glycoside hydrolase family 3 N-terminal domain-containing protein n=1 Tax=Amycolatopsis palatopharyngis TaxID=187982 RepID=UPI001FE5DF28|nr:glycoside hydrolase family 3 N-terminal domain-containing protein [Amycolatopsis palatopharyngis]
MTHDRPRRPFTLRLLLTATIGAMIAAFFVACDSDSSGGAAPAPAAPATTSASPSSSRTTTTTPAPTSEASGPNCAPVIDGMTARQRLAQLVVVGVDPADPAAAADLVRTQGVGGIFIGGNDTALFEGGALGNVQEAAEVPVSIAVDDEGGRVQRIDAIVGSIPSARDMARTMSPDEVRGLGEQRGRQLRELGISVNYAPDTDVSDQPADSVIGDRAFSDDPDVVREYGLAFAKGLQESGVRPVLKHFPGHGHADGDSHQSLVRTPPLADLRDNDLVPYESIGDYGKVGVMVGHLDVPGLTGGAPSSLSAETYRLLRTDYRFSGPVITDDLGAMRAIADQYSLPEAVLRALQAGADQALWSSGGRTSEVLDRLETALDGGELSETRVREALARVLLAKDACG